MDYVVLTDMLADGLIEALGVEKFQGFRKQISVVDIAKIIVTKRLKELSINNLNKLED